MNDPIPFGETVTDKRPALLSWDRCDTEDGYFGAIFDAVTQEVIAFTYDYPVKSPIGHEVVRWMHDNDYELNRDSWDWELQTA